MKTLIFFGNERLGTGLTTTAPVLRSLIESGYTIAAVVIAQNATGASRKERKLEVAEVAESHNIPVLSPFKISEIKEQLVSYNAAAGVLVAYGKMIPKDIIDIFPSGIVNIHPSLLPLHRGPTPIESVMLNNDTETGVSIMQLSANMDAGPVFAQQKIELSGAETKQALAEELLELGKTMLLEHLPTILDGSLVPSPQDDSDATYDSLINKELGVLDMTKPALRLASEIRAYAEWPRSRTKLGELEVIITRADVIPGQLMPGELDVTDTKELHLGTGMDSLNILELMPLGKQRMSTQAFLNGYGNRL